VKKIINITFVTICALLAVFILFRHDDFSVEMILSYTPENVFLAALFMLLLYAVKSISVIFPVILLQMASGFLFPAPLALLINFIGAFIEFSIPYYIGLFAGAEAAEKKIQKNEKISGFIKRQKEHSFFVPFFLRVISVLPCDLVSMYLGAIRLPFFNFLWGSFLGTLPGIIPATFMGKSITDPLSPAFLISVSVTAVCSLVSLLIFKIYSKKN